MAGSRNALGRGISALIPDESSGSRRPGYFECAIDRIRPMRDQPRASIDDEALRELADSIRSSGVLQPVLVRRHESDFVLIAGERRWRAARLAGLTEIPVVVKEASEADAFTYALVENLQREDLSPLEMAEACRRLVDEYDLTQAEIAERIGKSRSAIANTMRLLRLEPASRDALSDGRIAEGHARQLVGLEPESQADLLAEIVDEDLSVRATEARARARKHGVEPDQPTADPDATATEVASDDDEAIAVDPEIKLAEERLRNALHTRVRIVDHGGRGQVHIHFDSYEILEGVIERILERDPDAHL